MKIIFILSYFFFFSSGIQEGADWESIFLDLPNPAYAYEHLSFYTSVPHVAGTPGDYETAEYTLQKFKEYGIEESRIETFQTLLSYPKKRVVELVEPIKFQAKMQEDYIPKDPTSADPRIVPTYNGYSPSGNVVAPLVYVNYASLNDFETLEKLGVNVSGKIGIARYGSIFRGVKAMIAQEKGMIGLILYSDPADDGYTKGTTFPDGPWRPKSGVQRGSVQFLSICPGDPRRKACSSDPNYNYTKGIPAIPVQPISWGDAEPLLKNLGGPKAPSNFQGGLNFTYMIGPGPAVVHLELDIEFKVSAIWDVIARIPGQIDRNIILGNHRDAWVFGATDPNSGTATLLEVARSFGELLKQGWKPKRNIILCSWDGEEFGLLGSTAWAEANVDLLQKAVAYLNVDVAVTGPNFSASATPSLASLILNVTQKVKDPNTGKPISDVWNNQIGTLGSGSDYTAFLDHFGVASTDMGFGGPYGVYHSTYDDIYWMSHFGDPTYEYHVACAQIWGLMTLRLVDSDVLPFNYSYYANSLDSYLTQIQALLKKYNHQMDLSQLIQAIEEFTQAAMKADDNSDQKVNDRLAFTEKQFLSANGLPRRPYYKHVIQGPGLYSGYAASVFPGLTQTIDAQDWSAAQQQYFILSQQISKASKYLTPK